MPIDHKFLLQIQFASFGEVKIYNNFPFLVYCFKDTKSAFEVGFILIGY